MATPASQKAATTPPSKDDAPEKPACLHVLNSFAMDEDEEDDTGTSCCGGDNTRPGPCCGG